MIELMLKAQMALTAKQVGDPRYDQLVEALADLLDMSISDVESAIGNLALGLPV